MSALTTKQAAASLARYEARQAKRAAKLTSRIDPDVRTALDDAGHAIVAETDDYFIYSTGSLTPGYFGVQYRLAASYLDGARIHIAEASFSHPTKGDPQVNLGPTSGTRDPIVLRAKADVLSRMADILAKAVAS